MRLLTTENKSCAVVRKVLEKIVHNNDHFVNKTRFGHNIIILAPRRRGNCGEHLDFRLQTVLKYLYIFGIGVKEWIGKALSAALNR
jgi:hypothetical protein